MLESTGSRSRKRGATLKYALAAGLSLLASSALAANHQGVVSSFHVYGAYHPTRGPCITMAPAAPIYHLCIYKDNNLYNELVSMLLAAHSRGATCDITWLNTDSGGNIVVHIATCY